MNIRIIYFIIGFTLLLSTSLIFFEFGISDWQIENILKIVPALFSAATLVIALGLYDRFGLKKFIWEKKIKQVLEFAEFVKIQKYSYVRFKNGKYSPGSGGTWGMQAGYFKDKIEDHDLPLYILEEDFDIYYEKIRTFYDSIYFPKELHPPLIFANYITQPMPDTYMCVLFGNYKGKFIDIKEENLLCVSKFTFGTLNKENNKTYRELRKWIKKNTNLDNELKL